MPYSDKHNLIFLHVPKNAGTTINHCLNDSIEDYKFPKLKYEYKTGRIKEGCLLRFKNNFDKEKWNKYYKVAFVRNPYDRFVSGWKFAEKITKQNIDFEDFVVNLDKYRKYSTVVWHTIISQTTHLNLENSLDINCIYNFEYLERDIHHLAFCFDLNINKIPILNKTCNKNYKTYYNKKLAEIVYKRFKRDFINFCYDEGSYK